MENLNLLYNKLYYAKLGCSEEFPASVREINTRIFSSKFQYADYQKLPFDCQNFVLKTTYPGLLAGTGYLHGTGECEDDLNIGFSFDYASGQPYLPGSSIKGVLRSHFKYRSVAVKELLGIEVDMEKLEEAIFDHGDVFFDAVLCSGDNDGFIMAKDTITPHPSPTANPIPIHFLKVRPDVRFEFRFLLTDSKIGDTVVDAEKKLELFKNLLLIFGAGAKTNVGYGAFEEAGSSQADADNAVVDDGTEERIPETPRAEVLPDISTLPIGTRVEGRIARIRMGKKKVNFFEVSTAGYAGTLRMPRKNALNEGAELKENAEINAVVVEKAADDQGDGQTRLKQV